VKTKSVMAVISCYRPGESLVECCESVRRQVDRTIVVDDGSLDINHSIMNRIYAMPTVEVILSHTNRGLAHSLNVGIARAKSAGASHILLLDQDSAVDNWFVADETLLFSILLENDIVPGMIIPEFIANVAPNKPEVTIHGFRTRCDPITSGQLLPVTTFDAIGPFREDFFIDYVDIEFYLRMKSHGLYAYVVPGLNLTHSLGVDAPMGLVERGLRRIRHGAPLRVHPPFRTYYIFRNSVYTMLKYRRHDPCYWRREIVGLAKKSIVTILIGRYRAAQLVAMVSGSWDGILGHLGRRETGRWS